MIEPGDYIVPFNLPSTINQKLTADNCVGASLVLCFYLKDGGEEDARLLSGFRDLHEEFESIGVRVAGVGGEPLASHAKFSEHLRLNFPLLVDEELRLAEAFGITQRQQPQLTRCTIFFDVSLRAVKVYQDVGPEGHAGRVLCDARAWLKRDEPRDIVQHAPVLLIPHALPSNICQQLIRLWETENVESGFMKEVQGKSVAMMDYGHKIRHDHFVQPGAVDDELKRYLLTRVFLWVEQAFSFKVTRREDFRIACYDAGRGGYFRPHRDNGTGATAHRRFAMSLLLNDDYDGGDLRFPEYGLHRYRPQAGAAVVFSCSLLHEVTEVTAGRRFVLLSFFYGEAEAKLREEYNKRVGWSYRA